MVEARKNFRLTKQNGLLEQAVQLARLIAPMRLCEHQVKLLQLSVSCGESQIKRVQLWNVSHTTLIHCHHCTFEARQRLDQITRRVQPHPLVDFPRVKVQG